MKRTVRFAVAALTLLLLGSSSARADMVPWGYDWNASPTSVAAGSGKVSLSNEDFRSAFGGSDIVATNLQVFSSADFSTPDTFTSQGGNYTLTLNLYDTSSGGPPATLTFTGQMQGNFSKSNANVTNTFNDPITHTVIAGGLEFVVTMTSFTPPGPPSQGNLGSIGAHVEVTAVQSPEPSTMALAGLGVSLAGLARWRRRK